MWEKKQQQEQQEQNKLENEKNKKVWSLYDVFLILGGSMALSTAHGLHYFLMWFMIHYNYTPPHQQHTGVGTTPCKSLNQDIKYRWYV